MDKNSLILNSIIKEYLRIKEPIGSEHLKKNLDISMSSATIRNYFKKMMNDGSLYQEHISGGRVPTDVALQEYWTDKLQNVDDLYLSNIKNLQEKAKTLDIFCSIKFTQSNKLRIIENALDCFLVVIFDKSQFVLEYNEKILSLLSPLIGSDIDEVRKFCYKLGLSNIVEHIDFAVKKQFVFINKKAIFRIFNYKNPKEEKLIFSYLDNENFDDIAMGISFKEDFPNKVMKLKTNALIEGNNAEMLCIGEIDKDFEYFFSL